MIYMRGVQELAVDVAAGTKNNHMLWGGYSFDIFFNLHH